MPFISNTCLSLLCFALAWCESSAGATRQDSDVIPSLHPQSDQKFFKKDYPEDSRPGVLHRFDVPHPLVQDSEDYDKDFVQDENNDKGGYWTAQMEYDALKNRLARERQEMEGARQRMEQERHEYEVISGKEAEAERNAQVLEEDAVRAAKSAHEKEDDLAAKKREGLGHAQRVEKETHDVKGCEEDLRKAKEKLRKALDELKVAAGAAGAAADRADAAEAQVEAAEKEEATWEARVESADKSHKTILATYEETVRQLTAMEANLADSAKILSDFRAPQMDSKGGIVDEKSGDPVAFHSGGSRAMPFASIAGAAACAWVAR